jgi:hypothetical protein
VGLNLTEVGNAGLSFFLFPRYNTHLKATTLSARVLRTIENMDGFMLETNYVI